MRSRSKITVRYAETDQMGIAHHSNYPVWYEVARTDLTKRMGMTYSGMEEDGVMLPLLELESKYKEPAYYEDELYVEAYVSKVSPVKMEVKYEIYKKDREKPINTGRTLHAIVGNDMKPFHIKREKPEIFQKLLDSVEEERV